MSRRRLRAPLRAVLALLLALGLVLPQSAALAQSVPTAVTQPLTVTIQQSAIAISADGVLRLNVNARTARSTSRLTVRLRLLSRSGSVLHEEWHTLRGAAAGVNVVSFEYAVSRLHLAEGRYRVDARVFATGMNAVTATDELLVLNPDREPVPIAVVVRCERSPVVGFDGTFAVDPEADVALCDTLAGVSSLSAEYGVPLSLAVAPVTIDEFARAARGYETTGGVTASAGDSVPIRYAAMMSSLRNAVAKGTLELLDVPYSMPDLTESARAVVGEDLARQWVRADGLLTSALGSSAATSTAYLGDIVPEEALATLANRADPALLASPSSVRSGDLVPSVGCYALSGSGVRVLVADETSAETVVAGTRALCSALFEYTDANGVALVIDVADGSLDAQKVRQILDAIESAPWLTLVDIDSLGTQIRLKTVEPAPTPDGATTPDYWTAVTEARLAAFRYAKAAGTNDSDADAALRAILVAESALWSKADGVTGDPSMGRGAAEDVSAYVRSQFGLVRVDAKDTTLSGSKGEVPITLVNGTGKPLTLTLLADADAMSVATTSTVITALPEQNFLTVPVNLGNALSDDLRVTLMADDAAVAQTVVHVTASYIDRLSVVGMVVLVLIGLLVYIRRHVRTATPPAGEEE